jgi:hypothetical protein
VHSWSALPQQLGACKPSSAAHLTMGYEAS